MFARLSAAIRLPFALEALVEPLPSDLDLNGAAELRVPGAKHLAHAAAPQRRWSFLTVRSLEPGLGSSESGLHQAADLQRLAFSVGRRGGRAPPAVWCGQNSTSGACGPQSRWYHRS